MPTTKDPGLCQNITALGGASQPSNAWPTLQAGGICDQIKGKYGTPYHFHRYWVFDEAEHSHWVQVPPSNAL